MKTGIIVTICEESGNREFGKIENREIGETEEVANNRERKKSEYDKILLFSEAVNRTRSGKK